MARLDDNATIGTWDGDPSPRATLRPAAAHGAVDPLGALGELPRLDPGALRIGATLGQGGMGVVRLAVQRSLGREVAVKLLRPEHDGPDARRKLLHEAWVTGALEHPNVVPVYEIGRDEADRPTLVLKRIEGEPWSALIGDPARVRERYGASDPLEWHLRVLLQVCNAVSFAHARGVIHRDLKPDNVMLGAYGEVYVLDWGIAVALEGSPLERVPRAADQRSLAGTPAYLAPEQLEPDGRALSERTDVYLLGGVLYHVLHGHPPHQPEDGSGRPSEVDAILARARTTDPPIDPELPDGLRAILERALARRPEDRFPSVEALRGAVQRWLDQRGLAALLAAADADRAALVALVGAVDADPVEVLARLGACRSAYARALEASPDHPAARRGLDEALLAAARWRLADGDWAAADLLAREASAVPDDLAGAIARARERADDDRERLRRFDDERSGARTRVFVIGLSGALWTLGPIGTFLWGDALTYAGLAIEGLVVTLIGLAIAVWANESLSKSALNRRIQATIVAAPAVMPVGTLGTWALGLPPERAHVLFFLAWTAMAASYALTVERRFWPIALACGFAYVASAFAPGQAVVVEVLTSIAVTLSLARMGWRELVATMRADGWRR